MKYMGSKRFLLSNGLGETILVHSKKAKRVVDLFSGAGFVSHFIAEKTDKPTLSVDLQGFSAILANSIIGRTRAINSGYWNKKWIEQAKRKCGRSVYYAFVSAIEKILLWSRVYVFLARLMNFMPSKSKPISSAYGGYYFSLKQAFALDALIEFVPTNEPYYSVCMASLIMTASKCAAAPGHTAQPFQPTKSGFPFIKAAWRNDIFSHCHQELKSLSIRHARTKGVALVADALDIATKLNKSDLVIVDPPYSDVQYSRFYHVLETLSNGRKVSVSGVGRYPPLYQRPQSAFSRPGESKKALENLLIKLAASRATVIFTFPKGRASNQISGNSVLYHSKKYFDVEQKKVVGKFSTLGGNNSHRDSRQKSEELILVMKPKKLIKSLKK